MTTLSTQRVWFVTGASRGIGAQIVEAALAHGDAVVATARHPAALAQRFATADALLALPLDVTDEAQAAAAVAAALARFGHIDVLVNNAGYGLVGAVEESSAAEIERLYATNVFGLLKVTRAVLPAMRARRRGHLINISSLGGIQSFPGYGAYCSTKFAVEALTESLHAELKPLGIHATTVEPGYFRTDFLDASSLVASPTVIDDYAPTSGAMRAAAAAINHRQPGDPALLARALIELVGAAEPPLRLPLGTDTLAALRAKHAFVEAETRRWEALSASTDFAA